jgi:hypothetical protein
MDSVWPVYGSSVCLCNCGSKAQLDPLRSLIRSDEIINDHRGSLHGHP